MLRVSELYIYPVKSLGGIAVQEAKMTSRGLEYDRRWMLVDENGIFMTQRTTREMSLLQCGISGGYLMVYHKLNRDKKISIPLDQYGEEKTEHEVWGDLCVGSNVSSEADQWFSDVLGLKCRLVFMADDSIRPVDTNYTSHGEITSFSDGYPSLIIGQASLDDLNGRMEIPIPMNRFRPNIVFTGGSPFEEDTMRKFRIGAILFEGVKLCARCAIPTINQDTGQMAKEPTRTLAKYRARNNNVYFGQNLIHSGEGIIRVGDEIEVLQTIVGESF
ncbi:MOSC domain-containing protein [Pollutibacter soli]|uniref:MOSC domain-containing protein n=1 Tax=Pollutibacter soli TaxID=3034157 RepID=UPI00301352F8